MQKIKMSRSVSLSFEEGYNKYAAQKELALDKGVASVL